MGRFMIRSGWLLPPVTIITSRCNYIWKGAWPIWFIRVDIAMSALSSDIHNTGASPRPTETRLLVAFLRPICKQRARPPQLLHPGFARSGGAECNTKDSANQPQQTGVESVAGVLSLAFCPIAVWRTATQERRGGYHGFKFQ
jgi:hypothetical protein